MRGLGDPGDCCSSALWPRPRTLFPRASSQVFYATGNDRGSILFVTHETVAPAGCNLGSPWLVTWQGGDLWGIPKGRVHGAVDQLCTVGQVIQNVWCLVLFGVSDSTSWKAG